MKKTASLATIAAFALVTTTPSSGHALSNDEKAALSALLAIGIAVAAANHGSDNNSVSSWDEDRKGKPFSPSPGIVCLPKPRQCYKNGAISWRWTQRMFG